MPACLAAAEILLTRTRAKQLLGLQYLDKDFRQNIRVYQQKTPPRPSCIPPCVQLPRCVPSYHGQGRLQAFCGAVFVQFVKLHSPQRKSISFVRSTAPT